MRRLLATVAALLFALGLLAGCADDDGDSGSSDDATDDSTSAGGDEDMGDEQASGGGGELCAVADENSDFFDDQEEDLPGDEAIEQLDELAAAAPEPLQEDFATLRDGYEQLTELDEDDPESFDAIFELYFDPEFLGAIEQIALYLQEECGIDVESPSDAGLDPESAAAGEGEVDFRALRDYAAAEDAEIEDRMSTISVVFGRDVTIGLSSVDGEDDAIAACELVSGYVYDEVGESDATIEIQDAEQTVVAERDGEDGSCEAA